MQIPTPNIDLLASSGVVLNNYYVSPICSPSRAALLTGLYPIHTGMQEGVIAADEPYGLPLNFHTMGDHFRKLNYSTHIVGKWHQGYFRKEYLPTHRGFDSFFGYLTGQEDYYERIGGDVVPGYDFFIDNHTGNVKDYKGQYSTDMYTDRVVDLIHKHTEDDSKPFFIYMAHQSVHGGGAFKDSLQPPKRFEDKFTYIKNPRRRKFAGMVAALDESVGRVFKALNDSGQLDNTIIFFSNDNGGADGGSDGSFTDGSFGTNRPLKGGKYTLWEGGVRGTSFLWSSTHIKKPYVNGNLMHISDVLPTLFHAVGGDIHMLGQIDGINQWESILNKNSTPPRNHLLHNIDRHLYQYWAVRYENFKLTGGTIFNGHHDNWYSAPGQADEHPPKGICYECTETYSILHQRGLFHKALNLTINCGTKSNHSECNSKSIDEKHACLFDIHNDPCEFNNIAEKHPDIVHKLFQLKADYDKHYAKPENKPSDPKSDPRKHGGFWQPWIV